VVSVSALLLRGAGVAALLKVASHKIAEASMVLREENRAYECGFEHRNSARIPFSLRFYLLTLIFLLFDLEVVLLLFSPQETLLAYRGHSLRLSFSFVVVLAAGLLYEWWDGALE